MLIAQALGEYGVASTLAAAFQTAFSRMEWAVDRWGSSALWIGGIAVVVWFLFNRLR